MSANRLILNKEKCLILQPTLVEELGKSASILLQHIHYWLSSESDIGIDYQGKRWVYNSFDGWAHQIQVMSVATVKRAIKKLRDLGILITKQLSKKKSDRTNYYTIDYQKIETLIDEKGRGVQESYQLKMILPSAQNEPMYNKETEITSEIKHNKSEQTYKRKKTELEQENTQQVQQVIKNNLAHDLLKIWNDIVGMNTNPVQLTKERARFLVSAFKLKFNGSLEKWKEYCHKISSSDFLMGKIKEAFKVTLDWALKFSTIQKIMEGAFGVKEVITYENEKSKQRVLEEEIRQEIDNLQNTQEKEIRTKLFQRVGVNPYHHWFRNASLSFNPKGIDIVFSNRFAFDWVLNNHKHEVRDIFVNAIIHENVDMFQLTVYTQEGRGL